MVMRQHNIWCVCTCFLCDDVCRTSPAHIFTQKARKHTPNVMLSHHHIDLYIFNKF